MTDQKEQSSVARNKGEAEQGLPAPDGRKNQALQQDADARGRNNLQGQQPNQERRSGGPNRKG